MDPNACYAEMNAAYHASDWETAADRARDLLAWLANGGFAPAFYGAGAANVNACRQYVGDILRLAKLHGWSVID